MALESDSRSQGLLVPPRQHVRRGSLDSVTSALSDVTMLSHEHHMPILTRFESNTSVSSTYSNSGRASLRRKLSDIFDRNYGVFLVLLSQVFGSLMNIFTRLLEHDGGHGVAMHPFQILFARQSITVVLCTIYAVATKSIPHFPLGPPDSRIRLLLALRGFTGFFGVFGMYYALLYLPLSEATVLTFLAPILSCYLCSYMIPGETFTRQQQMAAFVSLIGVVFMAQPLSLFANIRIPSTSSVDTRQSQPSSFSNTTASVSASSSTSLNDPPTPSQHLLAIALSMVGVLGATGAYTTIRAIGTRAHAFISVYYFSTTSSIVCLVALMVVPSVSFRFPANFTEWALLISLGSCGFVMQALMTMGLAYKMTGKGGGSGQPKVGQEPSIDNAPLPMSISNSADVNPDIELQDRRPSVSGAGSSTADNNAPNHPGRKRRTRTKPNPSSSGTKATSMVYTQMLFALAADRVVFGTTPGLWSWVGSGLILAGAIWVASARDKPTPSNKADNERIIEPNNNVPVKQPEESIGLLTDSHTLSDDEHDPHHE